MGLPSAEEAIRELRDWIEELEGSVDGLVKEIDNWENISYLINLLSLVNINFNKNVSLIGRIIKRKFDLSDPNQIFNRTSEKKTIKDI